MITRRKLLVGASAIAIVVAIAGIETLQPAAAQSVTAAEILVPPPLGDRTLGKDDAPVTIVEYASMTCSHCAHFHTVVLPSVKQKYIDTGKARLILREFPFDPRAAAASMLARCSGPEKAYDVIAKLFAEQENWAFGQTNAVAALFKVAQSAGFNDDSFKKCVGDEKLLQDITNVRDRAAKSFGVNATPTFFINGKKLEAASDRIESFDQAIEPLLKK